MRALDLYSRLCATHSRAAPSVAADPQGRTRHFDHPLRGSDDLANALCGLSFDTSDDWLRGPEDEEQLTWRQRMFNDKF